jgi:hypothetical protein
MLATMIVAALIVDGLFSAADLIPATRPSRADVFGTISVNYKLVLNIVATFVFVGLLWLTIRGERRAPAHVHAPAHH